MSSRTRFILVFVARMAIALAGIALLWMMVLWIIGARDTTWERLQKGQSLRVAMDPSFPPFNDVDASGQLAGFDVDLARELGRRLGIPVTFVAIAFDGLADAVMAGKADVVISAFPLDERLTEDVRYSQPYFEAGLVMVTQEDSAITSSDQLPDATVAVEWGSQGDAWAREQQLPRILRMETPDDALNAVLDGRADAAIVDAVTAALFPRPGLTMHTPPLISDPYVIVLPKQASKLAEAVDEALTDMMTDGTWEQLAAKYFPNPPLPPIRETEQ
jgi:ABC-type amino acid transport substrate-binding protein